MLRSSISKGYVNYSFLMISVFVKKVLEGIVWKNEFQPQNCKRYLILPRYHEFRNSIKEDYRQLHIKENFRQLHRTRLLNEIRTH
jgi:heme oxygenase